MPVSTRPFTLFCVHCSWKKTMLPCGDSSSSSHSAFSFCPECHIPSLEMREATRQEILRTRLDQFLSLND